MIHKEKGGKGLFADQASQEKGGKVWLAAAIYRRMRNTDPVFQRRKASGACAYRWVN